MQQLPVIAMEDSALSASDIDKRKDIHNLQFTINQAVKNTYSVWLIALFAVVPAWSRAPAWLCLGWVLLVGTGYTARARQLRPGQVLAIVQSAPAAWTRRLNMWTLGCAVLAAIGPSLFYPYVSDIARMYICMLFCCWLAGAMASLGARPRLYAIYAALFTGGIWLGWLRSDSPYVLEILGMLALYTLVVSGFARNFARQVDEGVEIRFINERLIAQLTTAREAAEKSSEAKSRFLAVASHDLRQPLHAVTLLNGMLARPQPADRIAEISRQMGRSLTTLERLFTSVLDFSKIEADKIKPEFTWQPLTPLLEQVAHDYAPHAAQKGLSLGIQSLAVTVYTDPQLLERILRNLLENAIKFTDCGGVEVEARLSDRELIVAVSDTGPGIPANQREEIFKEYYQTASDKVSSGLGLGLAIVRRLATLLELTVTVKDCIPQGACFEIAAEASKVRYLSESEVANPDQSHADIDLAGYFIVYIDDDASARDALGLLLADWGCRTVIAESLQDAIHKLDSQGTPDVVLSDYSLRDGRTGVEAIEEMRLRYGPVVGAILTGETSATQIRLAGELEYPVLGKPVTARDLRTLLEVFKGIG